VDIKNRVQPIFIGGTGRSGTTILGDLLNEHSEIRTSNPTEIKFLANRGGLLDVIFGSPYSRLEENEKVSILNFRTYRKRKKRSAEANKLFKDLLWQKWWTIDAKPPHGPGLHVGIKKDDLAAILKIFDRAAKSNAVAAGREFMDQFISKQFDSSGKKTGSEKFWVETTPMNIFYAKRLLTLYPNAKFIVMRRDPRDVIASLLTKDWGPDTALEGIDWIETRLRADHDSLKHIPLGQILEINLEHLTNIEPSQTYKKIQNFLGIEDEPAMRAFHMEKMSGELASIGRWKSQLNTPEFVASFEALSKRLKADGISFGLAL
jgi:hypothetical protein